MVQYIALGTQIYSRLRKNTTGWKLRILNSATFKEVFLPIVLFLVLCFDIHMINSNWIMAFQLKPTLWVKYVSAW